MYASVMYMRFFKSLQAEDGATHSSISASIAKVKVQFGDVHVSGIPKHSESSDGDIIHDDEPAVPPAKRKKVS
jgi:hypothetical protein